MMKTEWEIAKLSGYESALWELDDEGAYKEQLIEPRIVTTDGQMELVLFFDGNTGSERTKHLIECAPEMEQVLKELATMIYLWSDGDFADLMVCKINSILAKVEGSK